MFVVNTLAWKNSIELAFSRVFVVNILAWKDKIELAAPIFWFVLRPKIANFSFLRQFHRLHFEWGQMTSATAIKAVPVLEEVCAGTTRIGVCGSI